MILICIHVFNLILTNFNKFGGGFAWYGGKEATICDSQPVVYCQRYRSPDIFEQLKVLGTDLHIKVLNFVKVFILPKKQRYGSSENFQPLHFKLSRVLSLN